MAKLNVKPNRRAVALGLSAFGLSALGAGLTGLSGCARRTTHARQADVIIVGAGLSGLHAALTLSKQGYRVKVFEASSRIGGRLFTLFDLNGAPEAGGVEIGGGYARLIKRAQSLGVEIHFDPQPRSDRVLSVGGDIITSEDWPAHPANILPQPYKRARPDTALFAAMRGLNNPFADSGAWRHVSDADDISAAQFLERRGFDTAASAYVNRAFNGNDMSRYSMANMWRTFQQFSNPANLGADGRVLSGRIVGGAQTLPLAMARALGERVQTGARVNGVTQTDQGVQVNVEGRDWVSDFCILAVPFPALRKMDISPALVAPQSTAIKNLAYTQIIQLHLAPDIPFWDHDGWPPAMWTDSPLERIFVNQHARTGEVVSLKAWINGQGATALSQSSDAELEALAQATFKRIRPASEGRVKLLQAVRWTDKQSLSGGAYAHFAPGQIGAWAKKMGATSGRVYFAGEHVSHHHMGMEGALESGERAARDIMKVSQ